LSATFLMVLGSGSHYVRVTVREKPLVRSNTFARYKTAVLPILVAALIAGCSAEQTEKSAEPVVVAALGDSYASGEGAPFKPSDDVNAVVWGTEPGDDVCHRSPHSGFGQAVKELSEANTDREFETINLACSGAKTNDLMHDSTRDDEIVTAQLDALLAWAESRGVDTIDYLYISIGGNDAGFVPVVLGCVLADCEKNGLLRGRTGDPDEVKEQVAAVLKDMSDALLAMPIKVRHVAVSNYPSIGLNSNGAGCDLSGSGDVLRLITLKEWEAAWRSVGEPLNSAVRETAKENSWQMLDTYELFADHSVCAQDNWLMLTKEAQAVTGSSGPFGATASGALHPNKKGYAALGSLIAKDARAKLDLD
jgi:lysophospholipase L1-like esterase